jgi:cytoskeleton protein RodZ
MTKDIKKNQESNEVNNELSCGNLLFSRRQAKDLTIKDAARELRIDSLIIKKLENDEFESIGAPVFVKGYLRQYAEILGLTIDEVINLYEKDNPDQSYQPIVNEAEEQIRKYVLTPKLMVIAILAILIILLGWAIFSNLPQNSPLPARQDNQITIIEPNLVIEEVVEEEVTELTNETDELEVIEPNLVIEKVAEVRLKVNYNGACWTEIYDAYGNTLFYDLGNNDQDVIVSGVAPLDVLFGAIDQVNNVVVDDQDFIMPMTARRGSVLRFEIATIE